MDKLWYVSRDGVQYGPFNHNTLLTYIQENKVSPDDWLWNASMEEWKQGKELGDLFRFHQKSDKQSSKKTILLTVFGIASLVVLSVLLGGVLLLINSQKMPEIVDYFPKNGVPGSHVYILFDEDIMEIGEDLYAYYEGEELAVTTIVEDYIEILLPNEIKSGDITLKYKNQESQGLPFDVEKIAYEKLFSQVVEPSTKLQTLNYQDEISIVIPSGVIDEPREVSISVVTNPPVNSYNPFVLTALDISIEGLSQLEDYIGIEVAYDLESFDPRYDPKDQLTALRYDEENESWVAMPFSIDEDKQIIYVETDHLCLWNFVTTVPSIGAVAATTAKTAAVLAAVAATGWVTERMTLDIYTTEHFRLMYNKKVMDILYDDWGDAEYQKGQNYNKKHPKYIQDIGNLFETAFANYMSINGGKGFKNPVVKPAFLYGTNTNQITVKIGGIWTVGTGLVAKYFDPVDGAEEAQYGKVFGNIHIPCNFFDFDEDFVRLGVAHELFHVIQSEYYPFYKYLNRDKNLNYWWVEATADYASNQIAWKSTGKDLSYLLKVGVGSKFYSYSLNSRGYQPTMKKEYEYASALFIQYLVNVLNVDFLELFEYVAEGEPYQKLDQFLSEKVAEAGRSLDLSYGYTQFVRYGFFSDQSFLKEKSDQEVADYVDTIELEDNQELKIFVEENEEVWLEIYKSTSDKRSDVGNYQIPLVVLGVDLDEATVDSLKPGETLYIVAVNHDEDPQYAKVIIELPSGEEIEYNFNLEGHHSAKLWAVNHQTSSWEINPEEIEEGEFDQLYEFEIKGDHLPEDLKEVRMEYDFGDGGKEATGSDTLTVDKGSVATTLSYSYTFLADYDYQENPVIPIVVRFYDGDREIGSVQSQITLPAITVSILAPRMVTYVLTEEVTEVEHTFEAIAVPDGDYKFVWLFEEGAEEIETTGTDSTVSYSYKGVGTFEPQVTLYNLDGVELCRDRVTVVLEEKQAGYQVRYTLQEAAQLYYPGVFLHELFKELDLAVIEGGTFSYDSQKTGTGSGLDNPGTVSSTVFGSLSMTGTLVDMEGMATPMQALVGTVTFTIETDRTLDGINYLVDFNTASVRERVVYHYEGPFYVYTSTDGVGKEMTLGYDPLTKESVSLEKETFYYNSDGDQTYYDTTVEFAPNGIYIYVGE